jgi:UDP-3-O-[3-hydroxymyristoyl] glucosamine N-acyltransferase
MQRTLQELAELTQSQLIGDPSHMICGVDSLESASSEEASFCANTLYRHLLTTTQAGVVCVDPMTPLIDGKNFLLSANPSAAFQAIAALFLASKSPVSGFTGTHPSAVVHSSVKLGKDVEIGPNAVIDQGCVIGDHTKIGACTVLGSGVVVGSHSHIHPNVTIREGCILGNRVIIQPGAVIGSCGYGYITNASGEHIKQEQLGNVVIEDDVEIGANTTIDRARFKSTVIGKGTKIDNLVMVAHNVTLGAHNLIVSQTGISGSVKTGRYVVMGGQTGTVGHIEVASGAMFAARSGIKKSIKQPGKYGGNPAISLDAHNREQVYLRKVSEKIQALEAKLQELEEKFCD